MSIRGNIEAVIEAVKIPENIDLGNELQQKAIAAIMAGIGTSEWRAYVQLFAKSSEQLARLMGDDRAQTDYMMDVARTYLIGNGVCGAITVDRLLYGVDDKLDEGLYGTPEIPNDGL